VAVRREPCVGAHARQVAADVGLAEPVGEQQLAARETRQQRALLRLAAVLRDVHATVERAVDERPGGERAATAQLLDHRDRRDQILARPAMLLGDGEPADAQRRELREQLAREAVLAVPALPLLGRHLVGDEAPHGLAQQCLVRRLVGEVARHRALVPPRRAPAGWRATR
jgi:hypothetical protein